MSSTELIEFHNGVADNSYEFKNSWGGSARIWDSLFKAYIPKEQEYDNWIQAAQDNRLWSVWKNNRLSNAERLVYWFSCDNALVAKENFTEMASALREFATKHPCTDKVCHLENFAKVFNESDADAIGLHGTSVVENPWFNWCEEQGESIPYDITKGNKHWFVFERLKKYNNDNLSEHQLSTLQKLEEDIFECGVDGGMSTSDAIDKLHEMEKEYGVYDPNAKTPRWVIDP